MREVRSCPLCSSQRLRPFAMASKRSFLHRGQVRCGGCGLLIAQPQAEPHEIEQFYGHVYYDEIWKDPAETNNMVEYGRDELPLFKSLWADFAPPGGAEVIEVGCGRGEMMELLGHQGFRVRGCEMSRHAIEYCRGRGLEVIYGCWPGLPFVPHSADVVMSLQVVEHVVDPRAFVADLVGLVRPGGIIALATEDAWSSQTAFERTMRRLRGRTPEYMTATDHTFVFQGRHLRQLLEETGCDGVQSRSYSRPAPRESLHWRVYKNVFRVLDRIVGHGDFLMAVGHKPASSVQ